jgi:hypothetical protein
MQVINAINGNPKIGHPKWPTNVDECNEIAKGWAKLSGPGKQGFFHDRYWHAGWAACHYKISNPK